MPSYKGLLTIPLVTFLTGNAVATPTPTQDLPLGADLLKRDDYVYGIRIAGDDEIPPVQKRDIDLNKRSSSTLGDLAACAIKAQSDWPHTQLTKEQSDGCMNFSKEKMKRDSILVAPTEIPSSDGKYDLGSKCSTSQDILKYFLFGGDFENEAENLCDIALSYIDPVNNDDTVLVPQEFGIWGAEDRLNIYTGVVNLGMNSTADSKEEAFGLCIDAVNYLGETCLVGISGTGNGLHPTFQHESQKPGTVVFTDQDGNLTIAFDFSLYDP